MFSQHDFSAASRSLVCGRLEPCESKEHQNLARSFLNRRFAITAFCLLAPDGKTRHSGTGRSPRPGPHGSGTWAEAVEGEVVEHLPLDARPSTVKATRLAANADFAHSEERKVYRTHVATGCRIGPSFVNGIPYSEDRNAAGEIDHRGGKETSRGLPSSPPSCGLLSVIRLLGTPTQSAAEATFSYVLERIGKARKSIEIHM